MVAENHAVVEDAPDDDSHPTAVNHTSGAHDSTLEEEKENSVSVADTKTLVATTYHHTAAPDNVVTSTMAKKDIYSENNYDNRTGDNTSSATYNVAQVD